MFFLSLSLFCYLSAISHLENNSQIQFIIVLNTDWNVESRLRHFYFELDETDLIMINWYLRSKLNTDLIYEYTDFYPIGVDSSIEFDRYVVAEGDLLFPGFRLLETENRPVLPYSRISQILISRVDVLHSWTIPRLGVKADANPGRVNHVKLKPHNPGVFLGQWVKVDRLSAKILGKW